MLNEKIIILMDSVSIYREPYMSTDVLMIFLKRWEKSQMRSLWSNVSLFCTEYNISNHTGARMLDSTNVHVNFCDVIEAGEQMMAQH